MEASLSQNVTRHSRAPLSSLAKLTVGCLAGVVAVLIYIQATLVGGFDPMMSAIALVPLIAVGIIVVGWRWAPLVGTLVFGLLAALLAMISGEIAYTFAHPGNAMFGLFVVAIAVVLIGLVASISTAIQNYRSATRQTPRALPAVLALVAGLVVGAVVVGGIPQAGDSAGVSPETLAGLPAVTLDKFENGEIRVKAGDTVALRLENPDPVGHAFVVDDLGVDAPMPAGKNSLALFKASKPGTYTFYCTPHYDKASGQGMHGTLIVE
ncbi:MAG TPA: cupredoxin domain-containing protein [Roseiflexaceae bacterium]|nr:cupredoxin domain-containing protein [Roseiflexaceae bacterium]